MHVLANILIKSRLVLVIQKVLIYSQFNLYSEDYAVILHLIIIFL